MDPDDLAPSLPISHCGNPRVSILESLSMRYKRHHCFRNFSVGNGRRIRLLCIKGVPSVLEGTAAGVDSACYVRVIAAENFNRHLLKRGDCLVDEGIEFMLQSQMRDSRAYQARKIIQGVRIALMKRSKCDYCLIGMLAMLRLLRIDMYCKGDERRNNDGEWNSNFVGHASCKVQGNCESDASTEQYEIPSLSICVPRFDAFSHGYIRAVIAKARNVTRVSVRAR